MTNLNCDCFLLTLLHLLSFPPIRFFSAKIKNIIFTEDAKAKLIAEQRNKKKDQGTSFVPTNIAVNYVQHNRCECSLRSSTLGQFQSYCSSR